jgi:Sulfotransferase family
MHHQYPTAIEEEIELQDLDFSSYTLEWLARVPGWRDFYLDLDQREHYAYLKKVLQVLTFYRGPNRWVLKSPQHLEQIPALLATFPDATFAITHRDPVSVIQSAITMLAYGDRMRRTATDPDALAEYWIDRVDGLLRACVRDRDLLPADRTIDVLFHEFMDDDVAMVERIYARSALPMTRGARAQLDAFMTENPRGKHGRLAYDLRGDFGVDPDDVRARFGYYFERFPVRTEAS